MPRYRLLIEYDGTPFAGWQRQADSPSVQGAIEAAIAAFSGEGATLHGAGRTDAGVHALGQCAHFDLAKTWEPYRVREAINFHMKPAPIAVLDCAETTAAFDARFSAVRRRYVYRLLNRRAPAALNRDRVWRVATPLDAAAMAEAATVLIGHHDFTTFRASQCQAASPVKTLDALDVESAGDEIVFRLEARSFLHNQVRSMVGSLKLVGEGKWTKPDLAAALAARDRTRCGAIAPACGLYLAEVVYPPDAAFTDRPSPSPETPGA